MNGLAGLNSYEADDQKLAYKVKVLKIKDISCYKNKVDLFFYVPSSHVWQ